MKPNAKTNLIAFRVSDHEYEAIENEAKARDLKIGQLARLILVEGLSGFDQKSEYMLSRLDKLDSELALLKNISLLAAAAATLPFAAEPEGADESEKLRAQLRKHFKDSNTLGQNLLKMIEDKRL